MPIDRIDHYAIRTEKLKESRDFYVDVVGLKEGDRPDFNFRGHWLYCGDEAVIHLIYYDKNSDGKGYDGLMSDPKTFSDNGTGSVDHLAFRASDFAGFKKRLQDLNVPMRERDVPGMDLHQIFLRDPNGVTIELNFFGANR